MLNLCFRKLRAPLRSVPEGEYVNQMSLYIEEFERTESALNSRIDTLLTSNAQLRAILEIQAEQIKSTTDRLSDYQRLHEANLDRIQTLTTRIMNEKVS